ncbi:hypothetical protein LZ30DRAFT_302334 [Colletotrichum cereale]|nr:hypothetical protein LZ30DRAFT_302334 [Colletotrichum cereale]
MFIGLCCFELGTLCVYVCVGAETKTSALCSSANKATRPNKTSQDLKLGGCVSVQLLRFPKGKRRNQWMGDKCHDGTKMLNPSRLASVDQTQRARVPRGSIGTRVLERTWKPSLQDFEAYKLSGCLPWMLWHPTDCNCVLPVPSSLPKVPAILSFVDQTQRLEYQSTPSE